MKKILSINTLAALLMAGAAFTACSSEDTIIDEQPVVNPTQKTVTMTVKASKDEVAGTRGLSLNDKTLNAVWKTTDEVKVYIHNKWTTPVATLHPTSNTSGTATLTGEVTGDVDENAQIVLCMGGNGAYYDFTGQKGVLLSSVDPVNSIESKYDYATAPAPEASPFYAHFLKDGDNDILTLSSSNNNTKYDLNYTEATASFKNRAAIVKFILKDKANASKVVKASQFDISCTNSNISVTEGSTGNETLSVVPDTPTNELYVAIVCNNDNNSSTYTFTAQSDDVYTVNKELGSGCLFTPGKYYEITLNMTAAGGWSTVDLSTSTPTSGGSTIDIGANAKVKLTGTLNSAYGIKVGAGATVMLDNATISPNTGESGVGVAGIHCLGNATIILNDGTTNEVTGGENGTSHYPGIYVASDYKLTIRGTGSLTATGQNGAAGIGAGNGADCQNAGNIQIENGTIAANGGIGAAGIGSGNQYSCGNITIKGGTITANGGRYAAGIGGICGDITITGGTVNAEAGQSINGEDYSHASAAIGSNHNKSCGIITITGGTITAIGRDALNDNEHDGANVTVIGASGASGTCTSITIGAGVNSVKMTTNRSNTASTGHSAWSETDVTGKIFLRATAVSVAGTDITSLLNNNLESANQTAIENAVKGTFTNTNSMIYYVDGRGWYFDLLK